MDYITNKREGMGYFVENKIPSLVSTNDNDILSNLVFGRNFGKLAEITNPFVKTENPVSISDITASS